MMNKDFTLTISIAAFAAAMILAFIPMADAIQNTSIVSLSLQQVNSAKSRYSDADRVKAGQVNCRHCDLRHADLTGVSFRNGDLTGANLVHSNLARADFTGATLNFVSIKGADLATARGLTQAQLNTACSDSETK